MVLCGSQSKILRRMKRENSVSMTARAIADVRMTTV
jgi:hypothetical protein